MSTPAIIGLAILFAAALCFVAWDTLRDLAMLLAPEETAKRRLRRRFGEDSPEYRRAVERLEGPGGEGRVILLGLTGLAGIAVSAWILFGGVS